MLHVRASTSIYTLSLHDALPISRSRTGTSRDPRAADPGLEPRALRRAEAARREPLLHAQRRPAGPVHPLRRGGRTRSEEHTSELQSLRHLVCRLLLEKKKKNIIS